MDAYHEDGLYEQRGAKVGAEPVVDFKDAGDEHDEGDVEGEAGGAACAVHRVDLVAIAGYRAGCYEDGRYVLYYCADEEHDCVAVRRGGRSGVRGRRTTRYCSERLWRVSESLPLFVSYPHFLYGCLSFPPSF